MYCTILQTRVPIHVCLQKKEQGRPVGGIPVDGRWCSGSNCLSSLCIVVFADANKHVPAAQVVV